jgi:hypothetical protein
MLRKIAFAIVVLIAAILVFAATRPDTFRVERRLAMRAAPEKIFPLINDFHNWGSWSPWEKLDPQMQRTHSGAASGAGAVYAWEGNSDVGAGRMEIVSETPPTQLNIKLDFLKPFEAHNTTEFRLEPSGDSTMVTWAMLGNNNYVSKLFSLFMNMDAMIGGDFEKGLANMKEIAERSVY